MAFRDWVDCVLSLLYPNLCVCCDDSLMAGEELICTTCLHKIPKTNLHLVPDNAVEKRFWGRADVEAATAYFYYTKGSPFQKLLHKLKYHGNQEIGIVLGRLAGVQLSESPRFRDIDLIVPVPLHKNKLKKRGFNQSLCIAQGLAEKLGVEIDSQTLIRIIENPTQTKKSTYERWENTAGIFDLVDGSRFQGKHILLVDDVLTTGSTLIACIEAIKAKSDAKVSVFTLAMA